MKKIFFKTTSILIIIIHLLTISFKDFAFADKATLPPNKSSSSTQKPSSASVARAAVSMAQSASASSSQGASATPVAAAAGLNLAVLQSFQADLFTGKGTFGLPIDVPAGRKGMQPNIALFYASASGNGIAGSGWNFELGSIERSTKKGAPKYDSSDTFIFNSGTSQTELVNIGGGEFRAKYEGAFMKFNFNGSSWTVTDRSGTKFYFGRSSASRVENGSSIFKWCLDKAIDLAGNYLVTAYQKDSNQLYPLAIEYTGNEVTGAQPLFKVEFTLEDRSDKLYSYRSGFRVGSAKRLSEILIKGNSQLIRKYKLEYTNHHTTRVSLLTKVTQYGSDGVTAMPSVKFSYQPELAGWTQITGAGHNIPYYLSCEHRVFDVNADGIPDIVQSWDRFGTIDRNIWLGSKGLSWQLTDKWSCPVVLGGNTGAYSEGWPYDNGVQATDVNGDGWVDLIKHIQGQNKEVWLHNKANGWNFDSSWSNALPEEVSFVTQGGDLLTQPTGWVATDINGDGLADLIKAAPGGKSCYINTGSAWVRDSRWDMPDGDFTAGKTQLCDLNADGLVDFFIIDGASSRGYINTGAGWARDNNFNIDLSTYPEGKGIRLGDVNSDGLADILIGFEAGQKKTYINCYTDGSAATWQEKAEYIVPDAEFSGMADAKGRFLVDFIAYPWNFLNNNTILPGLLTNISNGLGGEIQISYKSSISYDNTDVNGISTLAFPIYVVESVKSLDRVDLDKPELITRYEYKGGVFDVSAREFRGFSYVKTLDAAGNYQESYFKQDDIYKGRPYRQETRDAGGSLYAKSETSWKNRQPYTGVYFVYQDKADQYLYEGASTPKHTQALFEYDNYGNPVKVISKGDFDLTGDEKTQVTEYTYNTADWILGLPSHTYLLDQNSGKVSEKWFYYDNKGLLTKEESSLFVQGESPAGRVPVSYAYDEYGNLVSATDALGRTTSTAYDALCHTYPIEAINALGQKVKTVYYGINEPAGDAITGFGLIGQVKSQQDANGVRSYNVYDCLGRLVKVIGPNDSESQPQAAFEYSFPDNDFVDTNTKLYIPYHYFNGTGDYLAYPDSPDWNFGSGDFAVEFWLKLNRAAPQDYYYPLAFQSPPGVDWYWTFYYINNSLSFYTYLENSIGIATPEIIPSSWHHLAFTASGNTFRIFVDGKLKTSGSKYAQMRDALGELWIGKLNCASGDYYLDGQIAEYKISKGAARYTANFTPPNMASPAKITKKIKTTYGATPNYLTTYQFYNGLGNILETKATAEADPQTGSARQIVSGAVSYNNRGQVEKKYLPVFVSESADYVAPDRTTPYASFEYDAMGRLVKTLNPDGTSSSASFAPWATTVADENGHFKAQYSDAYGRVTKIEEHNNDGAQTYTTRYEYDTLGSLTRTIDDQGNAVQIWYDSLGRKIKMDDPDMGVWTYEYDLAGNLIKQTDAKGQQLLFTYDSLNRLVNKKGQTPAGSDPITLAAYAYDDAAKSNCIGRLSRVTDLSGSSEFFYDNLGREIESKKTIGSSGYVVTREYDALDRLTKLTYPDNSSVLYEYNPQGIETLKGANSEIYISNIDYSVTGQLLKIQYGNGTQTTYTYDPNTLRLTNLTTESPRGRVQDLDYKFDNTGNITALTDHINTASQSFVYDDLNRLVQANGSYGSFSYGYDSIGNMTSKEGAALTYGEGSAGPHAVTSLRSAGGGEAISISYDANGNMLSKGGLNLAYDVENRLTKAEETPDTTPKTLNLTLKPGWNFFSLPVVPADLKISSVLSSITGKYDQVSRYNPTTKKFEHYVGISAHDQFDSLEYGRGYQIYITSAADVTLTIQGLTPQGSDPVGLKSGYNLISCPKPAEITVQQALLPLQLGIDYSKIYHYNKATQLFEKFDAAGTDFTSLVPGESYYLYCLKDSTWNISNTTPATTFTYDGDGGRVRKTTGASSTTYIGSLYEVESDGKVTKNIFAGANRVATSSLRGSEATEAISYYHSDHLGSSNVITDSTGAQVGLTEFTPYGSISKQAGTYDPRHKFTGKELDESGLYYYGARYMDPQLGRFITADPTIQRPYDPQDLNRYSYCRNNPINYIDPTGQSWKSFWKQWGTAVAQVAGIVLAPFTAGASLYLTYAATIYSGVQAAQAGQFAAWAAGFAVSLALGFALPIGNFANLGMQVGAGALRGAAIGAVSGGVASVAGGGSFGEGAAYGAMGGAGGGAVSGFATSQQYQNLGNGNGFRSNADVRAEQQHLENMKTALGTTKEAMNRPTAAPKSILGVYRDPSSPIGYYADNPVIYNKTHWSFESGPAGILSGKSMLAGKVYTTGEFAAGSSRIFVYGLQETMTPTSWMVQTYSVVDHAPATNWSIYNWKNVSEDVAMRLSITNETEQYFLNLQ